MDLENHKQQLKFVENWFNKWEGKLTHIKDTGCGCCVSMWDLEGPEDAINEIPNNIKSMSEWSN